jgi:hypothetical protein
MKFESSFYSIKYAFNLICFILLVYQFIEITYDYLNFPIEVNLKLRNENTFDLPSITFCLKRSFCWRTAKSNNDSEVQIESCLSREHKYYRNTQESNDKIHNYDNFGQLFQITGNLSSLMECSIILNAGEERINFNDCKNFGKVDEFVSKKSDYEKCFTFFNINSRKNKTIGYKMDKSSLIEFKFIPKNFEQYYHYFPSSELDFIYLSIHSSHSIYSTSNFHRIKIRFKSNEDLDYKFSRSYVQNLEWPHETNCINYQIVDGLIYPFEDCFNNCILGQQIKNYSCIHRSNKFNVDILLNNRTEQIKVCDENVEEKKNFPKFYLKCLIKCRQNCITEYFNSKLDNSRNKMFENRKNWKNQNPISERSIRIKSADYHMFEYIMYPKILFLNFASNSGAIISLWFGVSVIDLNKLIKPILIIPTYFSRIIGIILNFLLNERSLVLLNIIKSFIIIFHLNFWKNYWKLLFKIICIFCFVYQTII